MQENYNDKLDNITEILINDINVTLTSVSQTTDNLSDEIPLIMIGGTEYWSDEEGLVAVRLLSTRFSSQNVVTGATCTTDILYPNQSIFKNSVSMTEYGNGIYHYNFTAPNTTGVYIYSVDCSKGSKNYYAMNTFHVSPWANQLKNLQQRLDYIDSVIEDINYTVNNLDFSGMNVTVDLTNIENDLQYLRKELDHSNEFSDELVYLITDSIIAVQKASETSDNDVIKKELSEATEKLETFKTLNNQKNSINQYLIPLFLLIFLAVILVFLAHKKRRSKKQKEIKNRVKFKPQVLEVK